VRGLTPAAFDRRLDPALAQPICVAVSGGGDSLAALRLTKAWADAHGRAVVVLHVDHGLQAASGGWRDLTAAAAARLDAGFVPLAWTGRKPGRGVAAAARDARHALIAEAARAAGAAVVVFGHTADDLAEAALMRAEGSSLGAPREWAPSPAWPEGRGVFLLRPLLGVRRAALRDFLRADGWSWIDDPANADLAQPRALARLRLAERGAPAVCAATDDPMAAAIAAGARLDEAGTIRLDRDALRQADLVCAARVLAAAALSAGGGARPPRRARVEQLALRIAGPEAFAATLAGAKVIAGKDVLLVRDAGETARGGLAPAPLAAGRPTVWDGRFELATDRAGLTAVPLRGRQGRLGPAARRALSGLAAPARPALPAVEQVGEALSCPILAGDLRAAARCLVGERFLAACGAVWKEPRV